MRHAITRARISAGLHLRGQSALCWKESHRYIVAEDEKQEQLG